MNTQEKFDLLRKNYLFKDLEDAQVLYLLSNAEEREFAKNAYVIHEGDVDNDVFFLLEGEVRVMKKDASSGHDQEIAVLKSGELIGELSLVDHSPRSASIQTLENSRFLVLPLNRLAGFAECDPSFIQVIKNISGKLALRLRKTNEFAVRALEAELEAAQVHLEVGKFLFAILLVLAAFVLFTAFLAKYGRTAHNTSIVSLPVIFIIVAIGVNYIRTSMFPLSFYGLTFTHWKRYALEGVFYTVPFLFLGVLGKWLLVHFVPSLKGQSLFVVHFSIANLLVPILYVLFCPLQEILARGAIQSSLRVFLGGSHATFWAIILSNALFGAVHVIISPAYSAAAFVFGCFWGWLFARQKSIVGCSVSHMLIGGWNLALLGYGEILQSLWF